MLSYVSCLMTDFPSVSVQLVPKPEFVLQCEVLCDLLTSRTTAVDNLSYITAHFNSMKHL